MSMDEEPCVICDTFTPTPGAWRRMSSDEGRVIAAPYCSATCRFVADADPFLVLSRLEFYDEVAP